MADQVRNQHAPADFDVVHKHRCGICNRGFKKSEHLSPFSCSVCQKSFGRQDVLSRHQQKLHNGVSRIPAHQSPIPSSSPSSTLALANEESPAINQWPSYNIPIASTNSEDNVLLNELSEPHLTTTMGTDNSSHAYGNPEEMLHMLMFDFGRSFPVSFPLGTNSQINLPFVLDDVADRINNGSGPGEQAMDQMSKLVQELPGSLTAEIQSTGITSAFLDTCVHVFFDKFNPSFPVLHKATFTARDCSYPLLLNIIALGSLFVGAKDAVIKGEALWRLAHIAVATNWRKLMQARGLKDSCDGVQLVLTALLGQTYAILSSNESLRMTSQVFHGLGFYWARQSGMYNSPTSSPVPSLESTPEEKSECWKFWIAEEVKKRAILGHYILDGHISQFSGYAACARHMTNPLLMPATDDKFSATTPDHWATAMQHPQTTEASFRDVFLVLFSSSMSLSDKHMPGFSLRVLLEGLQSLASDALEADHIAVGIPSRIDIAHALLKLHKERLSKDVGTAENTELLIRWHSICLSLATPSTKLCRDICSHYSIEQYLHEGKSKGKCYRSFNLLDWAQSVDGHRALLHALAIQDLVETLPLGRSHAIHLPAAIFDAGTILAGRCLAGLHQIAYPTEVSWSNVWAVEGTGVSDPVGDSLETSEIEDFLQGSYTGRTSVSRTRNLMYDLNALQLILKSVSSKWGVSHEMDRILQQWISIASEGA
ncbi:C2H2 type zinc finger domain protein [Halenospora varia]|nr:C2H2 type zinc finger domain protein [Halenospora varia]